VAVAEPVVQAVESALGMLVPEGVRLGGTDAGGCRVRWVEAGKGDPAVVLVPGSRDNILTWTTVLPALARSARVVAYDRAGLGISEPAPGPRRVDPQLDELAAVIEDSGAAPCVLVGHSWGGILAQLLASRRPDLVAGLVLIDPAHEDMTGGLPRWLRRAVRAATEARPVVLLATGRLRPALRRAALRDAAQVSDDPQVRAAIAAAYAARADLRHVRGEHAESHGIAASEPRIRALRQAAEPPNVPAVLLSATSGAPAVVRTRWTALQVQAAHALRARHLTVPGTGHGIHRERPESVVETILHVVGEVRGELEDAPASTPR
jgi:pimeloyl-ACP methyl ester carboxylesterase